MAISNRFILKDIKKTTNCTVVAAAVDDADVKHFILCDTLGDETFDKTLSSNKTSLVNENGEIIHDMYDLDVLWYHSQAARQHMYPYEDKFDYQHVYKRPTGNLSSMTKLGDTIYALESLATDGHAYVNNELYKWLLNDNGWNIPPTQQIATMLYHVGVLSSLAEISNLSTTYSFNEDLLSINGIWPTSAMFGVQYNTLYEIPGSIKQDFSKGELIGNTFKTKNQYDDSWSMQKPQDSHGLSAARKYTEVHSCGSTLWLKYKLTKKYLEENNQQNTTPEYSKAISVSDEDIPAVNLPGIEVIARVNRGADASQHKSNLYTLNLNTQLLDNKTLLPTACLKKQTKKCKYDEETGLSTLVDDDYVPAPSSNETIGSINIVTKIDKDALKHIKDTLANELKNCIRRLAENIAPANCQLFSVTTNS